MYIHVHPIAALVLHLLLPSVDHHPRKNSQIAHSDTHRSISAINLIAASSHQPRQSFSFTFISFQSFKLISPIITTVTVRYTCSFHFHFSSNLRFPQILSCSSTLRYGLGSFMSLFYFILFSLEAVSKVIFLAVALALFAL